MWWIIVCVCLWVLLMTLSFLFHCSFESDPNHSLLFQTASPIQSALHHHYNPFIFPLQSLFNLIIFSLPPSLSVRTDTHICTIAAGVHRHSHTCAQRLSEVLILFIGVSQLFFIRSVKPFRMWKCICLKSKWRKINNENSPSKEPTFQRACRL